MRKLGYWSLPVATAALLMLAADARAQASFRGLDAAATGVSADGVVVVGASERGPIRWTEADGLVYLDPGHPFPNGGTASAAAASADGATIVGSLLVDPGSTFPIQAVRWLADDGFTAPHPLSTFGTATDASADGRLIVGRGIAELDDTDATGAFAISAMNLGAAGTVTARVVTDPFATLGIATMDFEICPTDATTAACLAPAAPEAAVAFATNESLTFSVFMRADFPQDFTGDKRIFFNPRGNRAIVELVDENGVVRGSTSVAFNSAAETPPL